ncbi:MAG: alkyl hydroperoxide reductase [Gammaproteobacteria bacterium HGW-Gammaproteobacteria-1]|jgi:peroxiredoxin|nr:MAG: alkyl hydroperoxide reductase [Gammaproteobacteria bacterium HGW-Gammaproteobacteria-1]
MRRHNGETAPSIQLPAVDGTIFDTRSLQGRPYLLAFFRFAGCPFCNLRVHELVRRYDELGGAFTIVAVFDSPLDNLVHHAQGHEAPFPILADASNRYYLHYGIEHSLWGVVKGMLLRMPTLLRAMARGYLPTTIKGSMTTMPADFLVDANGVIRLAHYGADEGDHLPFEQVREFALAQAASR